MPQKTTNHPPVSVRLITVHSVTDKRKQGSQGNRLRCFFSINGSLFIQQRAAGLQNIDHYVEEDKNMPVWTKTVFSIRERGLGKNEKRSKMEASAAEVHMKLKYVQAEHKQHFVCLCDLPHLLVTYKTGGYFRERVFLSDSRKNCGFMLFKLNGKNRLIFKRQFQLLT